MYQIFRQVLTTFQNPVKQRTAVFKSCLATLSLQPLGQPKRQHRKLRKTAAGAVVCGRIAVKKAL